MGAMELLQAHPSAQVTCDSLDLRPSTGLAPERAPKNFFAGGFRVQGFEGWRFLVLASHLCAVEHPADMGEGPLGHLHEFG